MVRGLGQRNPEKKSRVVLDVTDYGLRKKANRLKKLESAKKLVSCVRGQA